VVEELGLVFLRERFGCGGESGRGSYGSNSREGNEEIQKVELEKRLIRRRECTFCRRVFQRHKPVDFGAIR
jgi:hypothetical protein